MNELQVFNFESHNVRTLVKDDEVWFVGKDVASVLGYQNGSRDVNRHVDDEDRSSVVIHDGSQRRTVTVINESGLYALVFGSTLPNAKQFKRWVTSEVLPSIRKNGKYEVIQDSYMIADPIERAKRWIEERFVKVYFYEL